MFKLRTPQVPLLTHKNAHQFSNGALIRVVGQVPFAWTVEMPACFLSYHEETPQEATVFLLQVQDMLNPEYIVGSFQSEDGSWTSCHLHDKARIFVGV